MSERTPYDGRPYYCDTCGMGWGEFMACEDIDCELESEREALIRQEHHILSGDFKKAKP